MNFSSILTEFVQNPLPFCSGFLAGVLHLKLEEDPLKSWLQDQGYTGSDDSRPSGSGKRGPQSISID